MNKDITYIAGERFVKNADTYRGAIPNRGRLSKLYNAPTRKILSDQIVPYNSYDTRLSEVVGSNGDVVEAIETGPSSSNLLTETSNILYTFPHDDFLIIITNEAPSEYSLNLKLHVIKEVDGEIDIKSHDIPYRDFNGDVMEDRPTHEGVKETYFFEDGIILSFREIRNIDGYQITGRSYVFIGNNNEFAIHDVIDVDADTSIRNGVDAFSNVTVTPYGIVQVRYTSIGLTEPPKFSVTMITREGAVIARKFDAADSIPNDYTTLAPTSTKGGLWGVVWQSGVLRVYTPVDLGVDGVGSVVSSMTLSKRDIGEATYLPPAAMYVSSSEYGVFGGNSRYQGIGLDWFGNHKASITFSRTELIYITSVRDGGVYDGVVKHKFSTIAENIIPEGWSDRSDTFGASVKIVKEGIIVIVPVYSVIGDYYKFIAYLIPKDNIQMPFIDRVPEPHLLTGNMFTQLSTWHPVDQTSGSLSSYLSGGSYIAGGEFCDTRMILQGVVSAAGEVNSLTRAVNHNPVVGLAIDSSGGVTIDKYLGEGVWKYVRQLTSEANITNLSMVSQRLVTYLSAGQYYVPVYDVAQQKPWTDSGLVVGKRGSMVLVGEPSETLVEDPYLQGKSYSLGEANPESLNDVLHLFTIQDDLYILSGYSISRDGDGSGKLKIFKWSLDSWEYVTEIVVSDGIRDTYVSQYNFETAMIVVSEGEYYIFNPTPRELVPFEYSDPIIPISSVLDRALIVDEDLSSIKLINIQNNEVLDELEIDIGEYEVLAKVGAIAEGTSYVPIKVYTVLTTYDLLEGYMYEKRRVRVWEVDVNV